MLQILLKSGELRGAHERHDEPSRILNLSLPEHDAAGHHVRREPVQVLSAGAH